MIKKHHSFDWKEITRLALTSRKIDHLQEEELAPAGHVTYQFSAKGHELGQVLISQLLNEPFDAAGAYYRSRPFLLGSGLTVEEVFASDMARIGSVNAGRDVGVVFNMISRGHSTILPMSGDVGSQYTPAAGWAQAIQYRQRVLGQKELVGSIAVVFGGEGSVATNGFWSCLTMATTLQLPLLIVIEDNGYALSVERQLQTPGGDIAKNLAAFGGLKIWNGSGTEPGEAADLALQAVEYVRSGDGPGLLRLEVPRLSGHSSMDNQAYKSAETIATEEERDPIKALRRYLVPELMNDDEWQKMLEEVDAHVEKACQEAMSQQDPDPQEINRFIFFEDGYPQLAGGLAPDGIVLANGNETQDPGNLRRINMVDAIRLTLESELEINDRCLVFGEDVGLKGGVHTATLGLMAKFGQDRVFDTSLSEEGIIGRATGMALAGLMPVPEIQFRKYADPAREQINNVGTIRWRTNNRFAAPMVVRMPVGFGRKIGDPWHSVTDEAAFAHAVGWRLAFPSNTADAVGLLRTALRGNDPVIFFEHRALLDAASARGPYPGNSYQIPFGSARVITEGSALTVVSWGAMIERCELAISDIEESIELIDLRTIVPWDKETVLKSVGKTSKCLIVHEDIGIAGFGAEIAATIAQEAFLDLDGPIERVAAPDVPVPFNVGLMNSVVPTIELIRQRMKALLAF